MQPTDVRATLSGDIAVTVDGIGTFPGGGLSDTGVYTIRYNVSDSEGNAATETVRTVTIADSQAPTITNATPTQTLECSRQLQPGRRPHRRHRKR